MTSELIPPLASAACRRCSSSGSKGVRKSSLSCALCASILQRDRLRLRTVCRALVSGRIAQRSQRLHILSRYDAPGEIPAWCIATAFSQGRPVSLIAQDTRESRAEPLRHQFFRHQDHSCFCDRRREFRSCFGNDWQSARYACDGASASPRNRPTSKQHHIR
jgi:hypothetical protein